MNRVDEKRNNRKQLVDGRSALRRVQKYFPDVTKVVDARQAVFVTVTAKDCAKAERKNPGNCALARACRREKGSDGAIIGIGSSYLVKDGVATRYLTSQAVAREVVSFDRHGDFAPGSSYTLGAIPPTLHLHRGQKIQSTRRRKVGDIVHRHRTANIRTL